MIPCDKCIEIECDECPLWNKYKGGRKERTMNKLLSVLEKIMYILAIVYIGLVIYYKTH